jgi:hypothetical protein
MSLTPERGAPELRVVFNWFDELKARAPVKK